MQQPFVELIFVEHFLKLDSEYFSRFSIKN